MMFFIHTNLVYLKQTNVQKQTQVQKPLYVDEFELVVCTYKLWLISHSQTGSISISLLYMFHGSKAHELAFRIQRSTVGFVCVLSQILTSAADKLLTDSTKGKVVGYKNIVVR